MTRKPIKIDEEPFGGTRLVHYRSIRQLLILSKRINRRSPPKSAVTVANGRMRGTVLLEPFVFLETHWTHWNVFLETRWTHWTDFLETRWTHWTDFLETDCDSLDCLPGVASPLGGTETECKPARCCSSTSEPLLRLSLIDTFSTMLPPAPSAPTWDRGRQRRRPSATLPQRRVRLAATPCFFSFFSASFSSSCSFCSFCSFCSSCSSSTTSAHHHERVRSLARPCSHLCMLTVVRYWAIEAMRDAHGH